MINEIKVKATYQKASQVPCIGQHMELRVNGAAEALILDEITVERRHFYRDGNESDGYEFDAVERWGSYTNAQPHASPTLAPAKKRR